MRKETRVFTYQLRLEVDQTAETALGAFGKLYGTMERHLFQDLMDKKEINAIKSSYLLRFGVTARHFNGCRKLLEGKIESILQARKEQITTLKNRIAHLLQKIPRIKNPFTRHQKQRHLQNIVHKMEALEKDKQEGTIRLCFGSKKLFSAQFHLEENGYASFDEWKLDWEEARSSEFFCIGSKDETAGNQTCVLTLLETGEGSLRLRLPNALEAEHGKYLLIPISFPHYGKKEVLAALQKSQALSYRFKKDEKGWRVFISFERSPHAIITKEHIGAIGVDINADYIALVETELHGNSIDKKTVPLCTYGACKDKTKALIGDAVKEVIAWAKEKGKPLVREELSFAKKKASLKEGTPKQARMLSSFHYSTFIQYLDRKGFCEGISIHTVNPAFTSVIGRLKFSKRYGLTIHHSAALVKARRYYKFSEAFSKSPISVVHKRFHVTFLLPVLNRGEHVWKSWKKAHENFKAALVALSRKSPPPKPCLAGG